jgi:hypothetical protein
MKATKAMKLVSHEGYDDDESHEGCSLRAGGPMSDYTIQKDSTFTSCLVKFRMPFCIRLFFKGGRECWKVSGSGCVTSLGPTIRFWNTNVPCFFARALSQELDSGPFL